MRRIAGLFACLFVFLPLAGVSAAETLVVGRGGTGDFPDITEALAYARPGDTVIVTPGIYREILDLRPGVTIAGEDANTCRVEFGPSAPLVHSTAKGAVTWPTRP